MFYLGVFFGGITISAGVVSEEGEIVLKGEIPTLKYRPFEAIMKDIAQLSIRVVNNAGLDIKKDIEYLGIGSLGMADNDKGEISYSSYFNFYNKNIRQELKKYIDLPIYVENDANCIALAESMQGASKNYHNSVLIMLNYVIEAGIILNNKLYRGAFRGAGEVGHQVIVFEGERCSCGRQGCWEAYASMNALVRDARIQAIRHPESEMFKMINGDIRVMSYKTPFEAAKIGDKWAIELIDQYIRYLATGLINIMNILQPQVIVLGGRIAEQGEFLLSPLREMIAEKFYGHHTELKTKILFAKLGEDAAILGAAMIGKKEIAIDELSC